MYYLSVIFFIKIDIKVKCKYYKHWGYAFLQFVEIVLL